jgi:hypothetical protein
MARHPCDRALLASALCAGALAVGGCQGTGYPTEASLEDAAVRDAGREAHGPTGEDAPPQAPEEQYWLDRIRAAGSPLARICASPRNDRVTGSLCNKDVHLDGIARLYHLLDLVDAGNNSNLNLSIATASSGLSFKIVSALNPRAFVTTPFVPLFAPENAAVVAFTRGEQLVEMAAFDASTGAFNFYLLAYGQTCAGVRCRVDELLSSATESGWNGWDLFSDADLEDTPLDCLSCHRPEGPGTAKHLLMRDFAAPWFQWMPAVEAQDCIGPVTSGGPPLHENPNLRATFESVHQTDGYAGFTIAQTRPSNGHNLHSFIGMFGFPFLPEPLKEPHLMDSQGVLDQWRCSDRQDIWRAYRAQTLEISGFPIPYYKFDILDPQRAAPALRDYGAYLRSFPEGASTFDVLGALVAPEAKEAVGATIADANDPRQILTTACTRCHDHRAPPGSVRAKFNLDAIAPDAAARAVERLTLPSRSPFVMPPARAPGLSDGAKAKLIAYLRGLAP